MKVYDRTISTLRSAVQAAKLGNNNKLAAIRRLDEQARALESVAAGPSLSRFIAD